MLLRNLALTIGVLVCCQANIALAGEECSDPNQLCSEPCPAENGCRTNVDCTNGLVCRSMGCTPSFCECHPVFGWNCTDDCIFSCVDPPEGPPTYTIIDLGTLGGSTARARGINEKGQVVGVADTANGRRHGFLWENGQMTDLSTFVPTALGEALGINNNGGIVGGSSAPWLLQDGVLTILGHLTGTSGNSTATAINDNGQVVGFSRISITGQHAFLWENGVMTDLHADILPGEGGDARDINSEGVIVGSDGIGADGHAYLLDGDVLSKLGTLGGNVSVALGVNDHGHVVGTSNRTPGPPFHAFLWVNGEMTDLAALGGFNGGSRAIAINNRGEVVIEGELLYHPLLGMQNVWEMIPGDSGWAFLVLQDINDSGQIVGWGSRDGVTRAFLMTPIPTIPTVSSWGLIVIVLLLVTASKVLFRRIKRCPQ